MASVLLRSTLLGKEPRRAMRRSADMPSRHIHHGRTSEPDLFRQEPVERHFSSLKQVREAAETCERCPLYRNATQTVFGEGPAHAPVMFIGEQPGDQEDLQGKPFVGPAGKIFDRALEEAGVDRKLVYVTNAVKHFKFEPRGKRRLHKKPNAYEIERCKWWLEQERAIVQPQLVVALGATAARSLMGRQVAIGKVRGAVSALAGGTQLLVTIHPSALLRIQDEADKRAAYAEFVKDLKAAARTVFRKAA